MAGMHYIELEPSLKAVLMSNGIYRIHPTLKEFIKRKTNAQARQQMDEAVQTDVAMEAISISSVGSGIAKDGLPMKYTKHS